MLQFRILIALLCILGSGYIIQAQEIIIPIKDQGQKISAIKWINQYPPAKSPDQLKFSEKLVNILFGKSNIPVLSKPVAVVAKDTNDYWILDQGNGLLYNIKDKVGDIPHLKDKNYKSFPSLVEICSLPDDTYLISDSYLNKLFMVGSGKNDIEIFNDTLTLSRPTGIAYSSENQEIWIVETNAHCISILDEGGRLKRKIGHRGDGPGEFNFPTYIWIDDFGKVFIVDAMNFRIQIFSDDGEFISAFGKIGDGSGSFARPRGIATDSEGNIYITDALFNTVQIFDIEGNYLYNFGMQGRDNGQFWMPAGIYIDENDYIYVADTYNSRVQIFEFVKGRNR